MQQRAKTWSDQITTPATDDAGASDVWLAPLLSLHPTAAVTRAQVGAADAAVRGPQARSGNGVTGAGIRIGILSDSFDVLGGEGGDIAAGLLPPGGDIHILEEGPPGSADEGRAMAQLVHATAPGAQIYFYTAFNSEADFAAGITALQAAGCQIIVDDTTYPDEPMFQVAGPVDAAVEQAEAAGVDYFTAVGNEGDSFYQAPFAPVPTGIAGLGTVLAQRFTALAPEQTVTIPANYAVTLALQWDAPYQADNADSITVYALRGSTVFATSTQEGQEPAVTLVFPQLGVAQNYQIAIVQNAGAPVPGVIKYILQGGGTIDDAESGVGSGAAIGHSLVPGVNAVGAVDVADTPAEGGTPAPESYSSTGPGDILFAPDGTRLATTEFADVPDFLAPDGAATSVFDPFFGTSAAAPVAAAAAALMLQAQPALSSADVTALLQDSAIPAGVASVAGSGLIQADRAVAYARTEVISGSQQAVILGTSLGGTIQGGGGAHFIVAGGGPTDIESQGVDTVQAGAGADTVDLTGAAAELLAGSGPVWVRQLNGADTVVGGAHTVSVTGGIGGGSEFGGSAGDNLLVAGNGPTTLVAGGAGDTLMAAGGGGDVLYAGATGPATLSGGLSSGGSSYEVEGDGQVVLTGPGANSVYVGGSGDLVITGNPVATALSDGTSVTFRSLFM